MLFQKKILLIFSNLISFILIFLISLNIINFSIFSFLFLINVIFFCYLTYDYRKISKDIFLMNFIIYLFSNYFLFSYLISNLILNKILFLCFCIFSYLLIQNKELSFKINLSEKHFFSVLLFTFIFSFGFVSIGENILSQSLNQNLFEKIFLSLLSSFSEEILFLGVFYLSLKKYFNLNIIKFLVPSYFVIFHLFDILTLLKFFGNILKFTFYIFLLFLFMFISIRIFENTKIKNKYFISYCFLFHFLVNFSITLFKIY